MSTKTVVMIVESWFNDGHTAPVLSGSVERLGMEASPKPPYRPKKRLATPNPPVAFSRRGFCRVVNGTT